MRCRKKPAGKLLLFVQGFAILNVIWYFMALALNMKAFPTPLAVWLHADKLVADRLYLHAAASLARAACGLALALAAGLPAGLLMARSRTWNRVLNPLLYFAYPVPKTALLPVVMLLFGLGDLSKIALIAVIVVFPVAVAARGAALNIPPETYHFVRSLGASGAQMLLHVTLPAILPELVTNAKVSVGTALSVLFFAEAYGTRLGLGWYIMDAWSRIDYAGMYLGILSIGLMGFALFAGLDLLEERVCRWKHISDTASG